MKNKNLGTS